MILELQENAVLAGIYDRARTPILPGQIEYDNEDGYYNLGSWEGNPIDSFASMITGIHVKMLLSAVRVFLMAALILRIGGAVQRTRFVPGDQE